MATVLHKLWCYILRSTAEGLCAPLFPRSSDVSLCQPIIHNFEMSIGVQEDVFGLQVSVNHILVMHGLDSQAAFCQVQLSSGLGKLTVLLDPKEQLSARQ